MTAVQCPVRCVWDRKSHTLSSEPNSAMGDDDLIRKYIFLIIKCMYVHKYKQMALKGKS